jgi:hypothetical protein
MSIAREFHAFETFPALLGSRGLQLQSNIVHLGLWSLGEVVLLALVARQWLRGADVAMHAVGALAWPVLFLKRRGPHNWYLALTKETNSVVAIALASAWMAYMSPPCSSASARVFRDLVTTAAFAAPLGGWEVFVAPAFGWVMQNVFLARAGHESEWSIRHIACIASAVPVGLAALGLQDAVVAMMMRAERKDDRTRDGQHAEIVSRHDEAYTRLPYRLQHTLQLLFNGTLCSAADVSSQEHVSSLSLSLSIALLTAILQVVGTFCIRPSSASRPYHSSAWWRWLQLFDTDSRSLYSPRKFLLMRSQHHYDAACPLFELIRSSPMQLHDSRCATGMECELYRPTRSTRLV